MQSFKKDSLSYLIHSSSLFRPVSFSSVYVPEVASNLVKYLSWSSMYPQGKEAPSGLETKEPVMGNPEVDALAFYLLNHLVSVVAKKCHPYESLGKYLPLVQLYQEQVALRSTRMFFYLLLICTRESRHVKDEVTSPLFQGLRAKYGDQVMVFHSTIRGAGSSGAAEKFKSKPPKEKLGIYVRFLQECFYKGQYSSGYGGKAWGKVTDCLVDYVVGKTSAEMMMDTAFTLCHNNGPIFNKGILFDSYSHEIYKILDVQRSGQIPAFCVSSESSFSKKPSMEVLIKFAQEIMPEEFEGYVDWYKVEALGSLKKYPKQKEAQAAIFGVPDGTVPKKPQVVSDIYDEDDDDILDPLKTLSPVEAGKFVTIMPGLTVKLTEVRP